MRALQISVGILLLSLPIIVFLARVAYEEGLWVALKLAIFASSVMALMVVGAMLLAHAKA